MPYGSVTASSTPAVIPATANTSSTLYNNGNVTVFVGSDSSVSAANGMPLLPGTSRFRQSPGNASGPLAQYVVTASGTADVRWLAD